MLGGRTSITHLKTSGKGRYSPREVTFGLHDIVVNHPHVYTLIVGKGRHKVSSLPPLFVSFILGTILIQVLLYSYIFIILPLM